MAAIKFKTTINCDACVSKVTPVLNAQKNIQRWEVDIKNPDKVLTIESDNINPEDIISSLRMIGYKLEII